MRKSKSCKCLVCDHTLKRRKWRKLGMGQVCQAKLRRGYTGIQLKAFEPLPECILK